MDGMSRLPDELARALERGAVVVTGNQRAARTLRHAYDRLCRARGLTSWRPPLIMAWEAWTSRLWQQLILEGHATAVLLNRSQEHAIWRAVVSADSEVNALRNADSLARMAADAWRLLCQHNGRERLRHAAGSTDTRAFQRWAQEFARQCRADEMLSEAQLEESLLTAIGSGTAVSLPSEIVLVGFDGLTPAQAAVMEALRSAGITIEEIRMDVPAQQRSLVEATDEVDELRLAAHWIRGHLEEHSGAHVAVIVPNLGEQRARIDRVFREVLAPELEDITANHHAPYEFSLGAPLAQAPMVAIALNLLTWTVGPLPLAEVSRLLLSPYFAGDEKERGGRAEFDAFVLREADLLRPEISLRWLRETIEDWRRNGKISRLLTAIKKMQRVAEQRSAPEDRRSYAGWADVIREVLEAAAWGAGQGENSVEFQTRRKWEGALDELATLDLGSRRVDFRQALRRLRWIAEETMFAVESREAPVQVMGPLEAAGSRFDALWFLGAGELSWPVSPRSNPLLPWSLQRELGMPGANPARDDAQDRRITRRLCESAEITVFSFAVETARGHQRQSAALHGLDLEKVAADQLVPPEGLRTILPLEVVEDHAALPLLPDEILRGGADVLRLQAACGFRAFAERRLWSTELRQNEMGLDARASGTIIHRALEYFWNAVRSQEALKALPRVELDATIERSIDEALRKTAALSATPWDASYVDVQRARLRSLMRQWLEVEKKRQPFTVKLSERRFSDVRIGPLRLDVRVDRVDAGAEGDILIDYKTGRAKPGDWLTDRPDAPQLPLYAVLSEAERLEAVAFAQVRTGKEMTLTGFATTDGILTKRVKLTEAATLEAQVERWRDVLVSLANDFYSGDVRVRPKQYPSTCAYCAQRILCRLNPANFEDDSEENEAVEAEHG
jgi:ATP-dependent helicase/nuclease subunit B